MCDGRGADGGAVERRPVRYPGESQPLIAAESGMEVSLAGKQDFSEECRRRARVPHACLTSSGNVSSNHP